MTSPPTRSRRQEAEAASDEVVEVAPGVLRLQLPIPLPGLRHVNCYALEDERGWTVVDPGMPGPLSWRALEQRCKAAGFGPRHIHTVVVTHSHPDHFGGAGKLRQVAGAEMVTSSRFKLGWDPEDTDDTDSAEAERPAGTDPNAPDTPEARDGAEWSRRPWKQRTPWGGEHPRPPRRMRLAMRALGPLRRRVFPTPRPSIRLEDAETIGLGRREWVALHTPGHTADHLCLYDPDGGVLLAGDHVLPTITPHISGLDTGDDPLADFITSLDRVAGLAGVRHVLPAHGQPFTDLPGSVIDLTHLLFRQRSWGPMAESETYAHLEHLRIAGDVTRHDGDTGYLYALR
jgi:glyoxylase-like metal-dependent hydrolase (beta-lactamase superfamily II)